MPSFKYFGGCPGVPVHEGIPIVFITIHGLMTQFVIVSFFCVPVHEDTTILCFMDISGEKNPESQENILLRIPVLLN